MQFGGIEGVLLLLEGFAFVYEPRDPANPLAPGEKLLPFILWPYQEETIRLIYESITEGKDLLIDKSRDMGATWMVLAVLWALWLLTPERAFNVMSRKAECVDRTGDPDCLLWKIDWLNRWLPGWLTPPIERNYMHIKNLRNGSTIHGESANTSAGHSGRNEAAFIDEASRIEGLSEILTGMADNTPCRLFCSTPNGVGSYDLAGNLTGNCFGALRFGGKTKARSLHWTLHPVKSANKKPIVRNGRIAWTSPWYEAECRRRASRKEIAEQLDLDYLGSGDMFFDADVLATIRTQQIRKPKHSGTVRYEVEAIVDGKAYKARRMVWAEDPAESVQLYESLIDDDLYGPRPSQLCVYAAFADISHGTGASNSVLTVVNVGTGEQVLEYATPHKSPEAFARDCTALLVWVGGQVPCLTGWEANGPGEIFGREFHRFGYRHVYGNTDTSIPWEPADSRIGWYSSREKKLRLFGDLRAALARGEVIVRSSATLGELEQCVKYPNGGVGPSHLVAEPEGARLGHGDRNVALAGAWMVAKEQPKYRFEPQPPLPGSFEERLANRIARRKTAEARKERRWG